jgi:hypothetical protein
MGYTYLKATLKQSFLFSGWPWLLFPLPISYSKGFTRTYDNPLGVVETCARLALCVATVAMYVHCVLHSISCLFPNLILSLCCAAATSPPFVTSTPPPACPSSISCWHHAILSPVL